MDPVYLLIWFSVGAIVAGMVAEPEGATDYLAFLLVWPFALLSGLVNTLWKTILIKLP